MQTITNLNNASEASARSLWIRTHSRHLECELLLDDRLVHLPDRSQCDMCDWCLLKVKRREREKQTQGFYPGSPLNSMGYSSPHLREIVHYNLDQDYNNFFP
ncbi:hypothetical protein QL285_081699 [Trifolium repens]|nr:hypothetical protein QL285_081699 [Trifolium repens]